MTTLSPKTASKSILARAAAIAMLGLPLAGPVEAQVNRSVASSVTITWRGQERSFLTRTSQLLPYVIRDPRTQRYHTRLVTVRTRVRSATDLDETDGQVSVLVEDIDHSSPRLLARFVENGAPGILLSDVDPPLFVTALQHGLRVVRAVETGRVLFHATGEGAAGLSAWIGSLGKGPVDAVRWAALETESGHGRLPDHVVGILRFGDRDGVLQQLHLREDGGSTSLVDGARQIAQSRLLWDEGKGQDQPGLHTGDPDQKLLLPSISGIAGLQDLNGFSLVLRIPQPVTGGNAAWTLARIPVRDDRLQPREAELAPGFTLEEVANPTP